MRGVLALARHSLHRSRRLLIVTILLLAGFQVLLVIAADELSKSGTFSNFASILPPFVQQMFGDSLLVFLSYKGLVSFGYFHPVIMVALVVLGIAIATEPAADIESRFLDVVLSRPLPRRSVMLRSAALVIMIPAVAVTGMIASTLASLRWLASAGNAGPSPALVATLALNLWAVVFSIGGWALAAGAAARRRSSAVSVIAVFSVALFLIDYLARLWKPIAPLARFSPFHYYDSMALVMGKPLPANHVLVLACAGVAGIAAAFVIFARRDL